MRLSRRLRRSPAFLLLVFACGVACGTTAVPPNEPTNAPATTAPATAQPAPKLAPLGDALARYHLIDVGQGAATLVEVPCGAALIDTGGETGEGFDGGDALVAYLDTFFAARPDLSRTLDAVYLTHPHADHTHNVKRVLERYRVRGLVTDGLVTGSGGKQQKWAEEWASANAKLETVTVAKLGPEGWTSPVTSPFACNAKVRALWGAIDARPPSFSEDAWKNANNHSVVLRFDTGPRSLLITGDLEDVAIPMLLARWAGTRLLDADVYEAGHHGSYNGTTAALLDAITPDVALVAMGPIQRHGQWTAWEFGHPRKKTIDMLETHLHGVRPARDVPVAGAPHAFETRHETHAVYGTGWDGNVRVIVDRDGQLRVETDR